MYKKGGIQNEQQSRNAVNKFNTQKTELPSKLLEQVAFNTRSKIEEHMLIVMKKSTHEEHLSQPLQTNNKQFKIAVTFLTTGYVGIFNFKIKNNKFDLTRFKNDDGFSKLTISEGAYELESLIDAIKRSLSKKVMLQNKIIHV